MRYIYKASKGNLEMNVLCILCFFIASEIFSSSTTWVKISASGYIV